MTDLIVSSWAIVKEIPDYEIVAGKILFKKIFTDAPGAKDLFTFIQTYTTITDDIYNDSTMIQHYKSLFTTVDAAISLLQNNEMDTLVTVLNDLGRRHSKYGVIDVHYPIVGSALIYTLQVALGSTVFTNDVQDAWLNLWSVITTKMLEGYPSTNTNQSTTAATTVAAADDNNNNKGENDTVVVTAAVSLEQNESYKIQKNTHTHNFK